MMVLAMAYTIKKTEELDINYHLKHLRLYELADISTNFRSRLYSYHELMQNPRLLVGKIIFSEYDYGHECTMEMLKAFHNGHYKLKDLRPDWLYKDTQASGSLTDASGAASSTATTGSAVAFIDNIVAELDAEENKKKKKKRKKRKKKPAAATHKNTVTIDKIVQVKDSVVLEIEEARQLTEPSNAPQIIHVKKNALHDVRQDDRVVVASTSAGGKKANKVAKVQAMREARAKEKESAAARARQKRESFVHDNHNFDTWVKESAFSTFKSKSSGYKWRKFLKDWNQEGGTFDEADGKGSHGTLHYKNLEFTAYRPHSNNSNNHDIGHYQTLFLKKVLRQVYEIDLADYLQ